MSLESYLQAAPKAELHLHLEGSIQPATLLELARRNNVKLPAVTIEEIREWFIFRDFNHFIEIYVAISKCLKTEADYELITWELGLELARQHVRYAEVTFTPSGHYARGIEQRVYFGGLTRGRSRVRAELGIEINWVFDISRGLSPDPAIRQAQADYTTQVAIDGKYEGVVALGLGGKEVDFPPEWYAVNFVQARVAGLHSTPHAGETVGPASIWGALKALEAERIGHGVRAIEDLALVDFLVKNNIPLEINPTSNLCLGVYSDLHQHPLRRLYEAGVSFTINSDDPPLFNTTLNQEIALLNNVFGFELEIIDEILLNGARHSFLPAAQKQALATSFEVEMARLKTIHL